MKINGKEYVKGPSWSVGVMIKYKERLIPLGIVGEKQFFNVVQLLIPVENQEAANVELDKIRGEQAKELNTFLESRKK